MTKDDIIRMAKQVDMLYRENVDELHSYLTDGVYLEDLEAFAQLVAAAEREACAKVAETPIGLYEVVVACGSEPIPRTLPRYLDSHGIAKAIRERSQQ